MSPRVHNLLFFLFLGSGQGEAQDRPRWVGGPPAVLQLARGGREISSLGDPQAISRPDPLPSILKRWRYPEHRACAPIRSQRSGPDCSGEVVDTGKIVSEKCAPLTVWRCCPCDAQAGTHR